jgi:hypothetical protein
MAEASGLNLLIDRDVNLDQPVTLSLRNTLAEDALKIIFSNLDCFYSIDNNVLRVEATGTRIFELGHPALVNTYSMSVGGDILSAAGAGGIRFLGFTGNITDEYHGKTGGNPRRYRHGSTDAESDGKENYRDQRRYGRPHQNLVRKR